MIWPGFEPRPLDPESIASPSYGVNHVINWVFLLMISPCKADDELGFKSIRKEIKHHLFDCGETSRKISPYRIHLCVQYDFISSRRITSVRFLSGCSWMQLKTMQKTRVLIQNQQTDLFIFERT